MSAKTSAPLWLHGVVALALAYGLSLFFWLGLGVFNLPGFMMISFLAAATGLAAGWLAGRRLWLTALVTSVVRIALYVLMTHGS